MGASSVSTSLPASCGDRHWRTLGRRSLAVLWPILSRIFWKFSTTNARSLVGRTLTILPDEGLHFQLLALSAQFFFEIIGFLSIISRPYLIRCLIAMRPSLGLLTLLGIEILVVTSSHPGPVVRNEIKRRVDLEPCTSIQSSPA